MTPGQDYAVWVEAGKSNETACYRGNLTKIDVTVDLSFTDASKGWNLIGNPFASAINWGSGSWVRTNTTGIAYVWDNGSYLASNVVGAGGLTDGLIPAGQAFFVRSTASSHSSGVRRVQSCTSATRRSRNDGPSRLAGTCTRLSPGPAPSPPEAPSAPCAARGGMSHKN